MAQIPAESRGVLFGDDGLASSTDDLQEASLEILAVVGQLDDSCGSDADCCEVFAEAVRVADAANRGRTGGTWFSGGVDGFGDAELDRVGTERERGFGMVLHEAPAFAGGNEVAQAFG